MRKIKNNIGEILLVFVFLILGLFSIFRINSIYTHKENLRLAKMAYLNKPKSEGQSAVFKPTGKPKREINIDINDSRISPNRLSAKLGDEVVVNFYVSEGYHNLNLDSYDLQSENIPTGKIGILDFIATKSGTFRLYSNTGKYTTSEPEGILEVN